MKELFLTAHGAIQFDPETKKVDAVNRESDRISSIYLIEEPTHVVYKIGTEQEEVYADADDIVVVYYSHERDYPHKIAVIKSATFVDNIKNYREAEQKRKEEWAAKQSQDVPQCDAA